MGRRNDIDWEAVCRDYRIGQLSVREVAEKHKIAVSAITRRAKKEGWSVLRAGRVGSFPAERIESLITNNKPGFVYVMTFDSGSGEEYFKIGMSDNPIKRLAAHQGSNPYLLRIVFSYFVGNMVVEESELHSIFGASNVRGEWFRLSVADLESIVSRASVVR